MSLFVKWLNLLKKLGNTPHFAPGWVSRLPVAQLREYYRWGLSPGRLIDLYT